MEPSENYIELYLKPIEANNIETYPFNKRQYRELVVTLSDKYELYDAEGVFYYIDFWLPLLRQKAKKKYINWVEEAFHAPLLNKDFDEFLKSVKETDIIELLSEYSF